MLLVNWVLNIIPQITKKFYENKNQIENKKTIKLEIQGGGNTSRSFIFIDDLQML